MRLLRKASEPHGCLGCHRTSCWPCRLARCWFSAGARRARLFVVATFFGLGLQRDDPGVAADDPRAVSRERRGVADADLAAVQRLGDGGRGWLAGLLYDRCGFYEAAFLAGLICNLGNLLLVALLVVRCSGGL
jgi:hypothetical protein